VARPMDSVFEIIKPFVWPFDYLVFIATCTGLMLILALIFRRHVPALVLGFSIPPLIFCSIMAWGSIRGWLAEPALWQIEMLRTPFAVVLAAPVLALTAFNAALALVSGRELVLPTATLYTLALGFALMNSFVMYIMMVAQ
jgi:hypothetical protein